MKRNSYKKGLIVLLLVLLLTCTFFSACSKSHSITFNVDGAEYETIATSGKESITLPTSPTKDGYTFVGWYEDDGVWNVPFTADSLTERKLSGDLVVFAKWETQVNEPTEYAVTFVGGEEATGTAPQAQSLAANTQLTLPANTFTKEGYDFAGWSDGTDTYAAAAAYTVPANNVEFTATWLITQVNVSFNVDGGVALTPLALDYGSAISLTQAPKALKENVRFAGWFLDEGLTQPLAYGGHKFKQDTVLYASYAEAAAPAESNYYWQEETLLTAQPENVTFTVASATPLTAANLSTFVTVTSTDNTVPSLTVTDGAEDGQYLIAPAQLYEQGGEYKITVSEGLQILAQIREEEISVSVIIFRIAAPERNIIQKSDKIINVGVADYYSYTDETVGLKQQFVFDKEVAKGSILCITAADGKEEHYKAGDFTYKTVGTQAYYDVQLLPCELFEVYDNVDITCDGSATFSDDEIDFLATEDSVEDMFLSNADYQAYQGLVASAIQDYAVSLGVEPTVKIVDNKISFSFDKGKIGSATYALITLSASFKVEFSANTYAVVTIKAEEQVIADFTGHIYVFADFFNTEGGSTYDIDFLTILRSETSFKMDVILTNEGKKFNIKNDLEKLVNNYDADSFVGMYKKNLELSGGELTVIDFQVCRLAIPIKIVEVGMPISFRTKIDVNAPFSCEMTVIIEKGYLIKGTHKTGLKRETTERVTYYSLEFGSVGYLGVRAGIAVGVELSFTNLSCVGVIGLEVEVGAYFDYSGYGSQEISGLYIFGSGNHHNKGKAVYYYKFGIYLDINAYVRSKLFKFDRTAGLYSKEFPLFDGGTRYVILEFEDYDEEQVIVTGAPTYNLLEAGLLDMSVLDLETGKLSTVAADLNYVKAWTQSVTTYDTSTGNINVRPSYVANNRRVDDVINISFSGKHADLANYSLYRTVKYTYLPPSLNIAPEDVDKTCNVSFQMDGTTIYTEEVKIGKYISHLDEVLDEAQKVNEYITYVSWGEQIGSPVLDDVVLSPKSINYIQGEISFTYMVSRGNNVGYISGTLRDDVGTKVSDLISQLEGFSEEVGGAYKFTGWDGDTNATLPPLSYYEGGKNLQYTALYEKIPFEYTIMLSPRYDAEDNMIEDKRVVTHTYTYGDRVSYNYDKELQKVGYRLALIGDDERNYGEDQTAVGPVIIQGTYTLSDNYTVTVYSDYTETNVLYTQSDIPYGTDLSGILDGSLTGAEILTQYVNEFDSTVFKTEQGIMFKRVFLGWAGASLLDSVTMDISIYGLSELENLGMFTHTVKFNALGGTFPKHVENKAVNGIALVANDTLEEADLSELEPSYKSANPQDDGFEYVFIGWYDNAELTGEPYTTITADADKTMYAKYEKQTKSYAVRIVADGYWQRVEEDANGNYVTASDAVDGAFEGDQAQYELNNITYSAANALVEAICNGTVNTEEYPDFAKIPIPQDDTFRFSYWQVCVFDNYQELVPIYSKSDTTITINFYFGQGVAYNDNHVYSSVIELGANETFEIRFDKLFTPWQKYSGHLYNAVTEELDSIQYCYADENYFYVPKSPICWSKTKNGLPITETDYPNLTAVFNGDDEIRSYDFYALYDAVPKTKTVQFIIEFLDAELESWANPELDSWSYSVERSYGEVLTADMIPTALKGIPNTETPYEYEFSHWMRMYFNPDYPNSYDYLIADELATYTTQDLLAQENAFSEEVIYKAVFVKKTRYVTVTFDAGENGHFASNDSRYRTITIPACVDVSFGETPVYDEPQTGYYYYAFSSWSYAEPFSFQNDATVTAYSRQIRNDTPAPDTGITVSWLNYSGDIGSAHNDIPGFFYYPDEGRVDVYGTGLTFTGEAQDIYFNIGSGNVTLSDLTLTVNNTYPIYLLPAYYNNMSGLNKQFNIPIGINIMGTVELNSTYTTVIGNSGNYEIHLNGIGQDAKLVLNHNSQSVEAQDVRLMELYDYLFIDNLTIEANAKIHQTSTFIAFPLQHIYLTMTNSNITVTLEGSTVGEDNTYENAYAFYIDPVFSEGVFLPDDLSGNLSVSGCEKLFVDQPDDETPIPYPSWQQPNA